MSVSRSRVPTMSEVEKGPCEGVLEEMPHARIEECG